MVYFLRFLYCYQLTRLAQTSTFSRLTRALLSPSHSRSRRGILRLILSNAVRWLSRSRLSFNTRHLGTAATGLGRVGVCRILYSLKSRTVMMPGLLRRSGALVKRRPLSNIGRRRGLLDSWSRPRCGHEQSSRAYQRGRDYHYSILSPRHSDPSLLTYSILSTNRLT